MLAVYHWLTQGVSGVGDVLSLIKDGIVGVLSAHDARVFKSIVSGNTSELLLDRIAMASARLVAIPPALSAEDASRAQTPIGTVPLLAVPICRYFCIFRLLR